jgi:HisJ family histidinol phosphate phosphatase
MVYAAKKMELAEYSITEHVSQFAELRDTVGFGDVHPTGRVFSSLAEYRREFEKIESTEDLEIYRGLEVDFATRYEKRVGEFVDQEKWDILLCSVHEFGDGKSIEYIGDWINNPEKAYRKWSEYFGLLKTALESDFVPFQVLTHPVRVAKRMKYIPPNIDELLLDLAKCARRTGKKLELNGRDLKYVPELVRKLAVACSVAGCRVSVGSDAHIPHEVFQNLDVAVKLVDEFGLQI